MNTLDIIRHLQLYIRDYLIIVILLILAVHIIRKLRSMLRSIDSTIGKEVELLPAYIDKVVDGKILKLDVPSSASFHGLRRDLRASQDQLAELHSRILRMSTNEKELLELRKQWLSTQSMTETLAENLGKKGGLLASHEARVLGLEQRLRKVERKKHK